MKIYVIISSGNEARTELDGIYTDYKAALKAYESIKKDWKKWAKATGIIEENEESYTIGDEKLRVHRYNLKNNEDDLACSLYEREVKPQEPHKSKYKLECLDAYDRVIKQFYYDGLEFAFQQARAWDKDDVRIEISKVYADEFGNYSRM